MPQLGLDDVNDSISGSKVISIIEHAAYISIHCSCFEINCAHGDDWCLFFQVHKAPIVQIFSFSSKNANFSKIEIARKAMRMERGRGWEGERGREKGIGWEWIQTWRHQEYDTTRLSSNSSVNDSSTFSQASQRWYPERKIERLDPMMNAGEWIQFFKWVFDGMELFNCGRGKCRAIWWR